jgi:hypothetical protein
MKSVPQFAKLIVLAAILTIAAPFTTTRTSARQTETVERSVNFGSIGVARGETIRVVGLAVAPCDIPVEFVFLDGNGGVIAAHDISVMPEHFEAFDLNFDSLGRRDNRLQLRVLVKYSVHAEHADIERLIANVEIIDNKTGKTTVGWSVPEPPECPAPQL